MRGVSMKSVLFFIEALSSGGAETVFNNLIRYIDKTKYDITVVTERDKELFTDEIKSQVKFKSFVKAERSKARDIFNKTVIKSSLKAPEKIIRNFYIGGKYDIEVAFCEGYSTKIIGNSGSRNCKKIAWVHTDVINNPWSERIFGDAKGEKECYSNFDKIVCVSETIRQSFIKKYGFADKITVVPNIIDTEKIILLSREACNTPADHPYFTTAGRFESVKGYERLIDILSKLKQEGYFFRLDMMGEGTLEAALKEKIKSKNLFDEIRIIGFQNNPYKYIAKSDAFICSSYAEGYSTVVAESVAMNIPVITTLCSGMKEIFGQNQCGIICENNDDALYKAIKYFLDNPQKKEFYSHEESIRAREFSISKQLNVVEKLLDEE